MALDETNIVKSVMLRASELSARLFRNNQGAYKHPSGYYVKYGVCNPGGSDLIGFIPVTVTESMVGKKIAVFLAVEVKTATGKLSPEQKNFLQVVNASGGIGICAKSSDEFADECKKLIVFPDREA